VHGPAFSRGLRVVATVLAKPASRAAIRTNRTFSPMYLQERRGVVERRDQDPRAPVMEIIVAGSSHRRRLDRHAATAHRIVAGTFAPANGRRAARLMIG